MGSINTQDRKSLGKRLRNTRRYLGLTQREVATKLRIQRWTLSRIENGKRRIDFWELERIADIYKQPVDYFTGTIEAANKIPIYGEQHLEQSQSLISFFISPAKFVPEHMSYLERLEENLPVQDKIELERFLRYLHIRSEYWDSKRVSYEDSMRSKYWGSKLAMKIRF